MESSSENCSVKVAVHVRPLLAAERAKGCKECVAVNPGKPQLQIGSRSFTFDHVYPNTASPSSAMFEECVAPLVHGLFQGYNATVLAYGQTGSGKTYTMGTAFKEGCQKGLIPRVFSALFNEISTQRHQTEFQIHVSFIEILNEKIRDLLDAGKCVAANGHARRVSVKGRPCIQIRESSNGVINLSGATEVAVDTLQEMAACLQQGSLSRATGSTNMNNHSSRSHAIFTITLEQVRKIHPVSSLNETRDKYVGEEHFFAKLHLVDLAGSERAKRTGSDGLQSKEGIHINKGLLALGNVITALGDQKNRKEGAHIPYRDSKLTRLLQDSLGGNSRTVLIACISPADINAEESLTTLKYANRARNIRNKPVINGDLTSSKLRRMNQQPEDLNLQISCSREAINELQVLREKISRLEATNKELSRQTCEYHSKCTIIEKFNMDAGVHLGSESNGIKRGFQSIDFSDNETGGAASVESFGERGQAAKEGEHAPWQNSVDKDMDTSKITQRTDGQLRAFMLMASHLSGAEEIEHARFGSNACNRVRSLAAAKNLLQYMFSAATEARCQVWEKDRDIKDIGEELYKLTSLLRASQSHGKDLIKEQKMREQTVAIALATSSLASSRLSTKRFSDGMSGYLFPNLLTTKHLKFSTGIADPSLIRESSAFPDQTKTVALVEQLPITKVAAAGQRLWKLKKSHRQWMFELKIKWRKPWKLSEWIKHSDETLIRPRSYKQSLVNAI